MKQTAVEWLVEQMLVCNYINKKQYDNCKSWLLQEAKEMEDEQKDKFVIDFYNWCKSESTENLLHDLIIVGEVDKNVTIEQILEIFKNK